MKKFLAILLGLAVLGAAGYFGYQYYQEHYAAAKQTTTDSGYTQYVVSTGNLSKTVTGTGTLSISQTQDVSRDYALTVKRALVEAGEVVTAGQSLVSVDTDALSATITALQEELTTCETSIATLTDDYSSTAYLRMPQDGRIKEIYLKAGQYVEDVMESDGCIALLSLDGWMYVDVPVVDGMFINDTARVKLFSGTLTGTVRAIANGMATITFSDAYSSEGASAEITYDGQSLGTATVHIHMPFKLTTTDKGYVYSVYANVNDHLRSNGKFAYLINVPMSEDFDTLCATRDALTARLKEMKELLAKGEVTAPTDGIVASVVEPGSAELAAGTALCSLYVGDEKEMVVSVDELDIISVALGQDVDIAMDAITDKTYAAKVSRISQIGTATSGVTVYDVTLTIDGDDQLKLGMNGTATIKIEEVSDVLLVPISAMNSSRSGSYVWLYSADTTAESGDPGVKTFIETGLSDEDYAEVKSGLSAGDVVMITREAGTSTTAESQMGFDMGGMMDLGGGGMPAGGTMPSGGAAPSGGGRGTGTGSGRPGGN